MSYSGNHPRFSKKKDESYDASKAYDKDLSSKARMHYLENDIADHKGMSRYGKHKESPASNYSVEKGSHSHPHKDGMSRMSPLNNSEMYLKGMAGSMNRKGMKGDSYSVPAEKLGSIQKSEGMSRKASPLNDMNHKEMSKKELHQHGMVKHPAKNPNAGKDGLEGIAGKKTPSKKKITPSEGPSRKISAKRAARKVAKGKGTMSYKIGGKGPDNAPGGKNNKGTYRRSKGTKTVSFTKSGKKGTIEVLDQGKGREVR